jgi:hypothetical protein
VNRKPQTPLATTNPFKLEAAIRRHIRANF